MILLFKKDLFTFQYFKYDKLTMKFRKKCLVFALLIIGPFFAV